MRRKAKLLTKNAYGLDQKGEVGGSFNEPLNIEDTSTPLSQHKTPINPANTITDVEAEVEFPGLGEHQHRYPSRGRG